MYAMLEYDMWKKAIAEAKVDPRVSLQFQLIVEPFHPFSFTAAIAAHTVAKHAGVKGFFGFAEQTWKNHDSFVQNWNDANYPLANLTEQDVVTKLSAFSRGVGVSDKDFYQGMTNRSTAGSINPWSVAREQWKMAVARGVASSPWYFVNSVPYYAAGDNAHLGIDNWLDLIEKLANVEPRTTVVE